MEASTAKTGKATWLHATPEGPLGGIAQYHPDSVGGSESHTILLTSEIWSAPHSLMQAEQRRNMCASS